MYLLRSNRRFIASILARAALLGAVIYFLPMLFGCSGGGSPSPSTKPTVPPELGGKGGQDVTITVQVMNSSGMVVPGPIGTTVTINQVDSSGNVLATSTAQTKDPTTMPAAYQPGTVTFPGAIISGDSYTMTITPPAGSGYLPITLPASGGSLTSDQLNQDKVQTLPPSQFTMNVTVQNFRQGVNGGFTIALFKGSDTRTLSNLVGQQFVNNNTGGLLTVNNLNFGTYTAGVFLGEGVVSAQAIFSQRVTVSSTNDLTNGAKNLTIDFSTNPPTVTPNVALSAPKRLP